MFLVLARLGAPSRDHFVFVHKTASRCSKQFRDPYSIPDKSQAVGFFWFQKLLHNFVPPAGIEPATVGLKGRCSTD